jgi:hypothetical protein
MSTITITSEGALTIDGASTVTAQSATITNATLSTTTPLTVTSATVQAQAVDVTGATTVQASTVTASGQVAINTPNTLELTGAVTLTSTGAITINQGSEVLPKAFTYIDDTNPVTGDFITFKALADSVISAVTPTPVGSPFTSVPVKGGDQLLFEFTSITLSSGKGVAYHRVAA